MRRNVATAAGVLLALGLAGCSGASPAATIDSSEAASTYSSVIADLSARLAETEADSTWTIDPEGDDLGSTADGCSLWLADATSDDFTVTDTGDWASLIDAVNPVLEEHGFPAVTEEDDIKGGYRGIRSVDDAGAELRILAKSETQITLEVPVTDTECDD